MKKKEREQLRRTLYITLIFSFLTIILAIYIQNIGNGEVGFACSYLDPITIDILAFLAGIFFVIEGLARIYEHPSASLKRQFTRILRIGAGFAILTLHIMQFIHK
jgi:hypothetical protein